MILAGGAGLLASPLSAAHAGPSRLRTAARRLANIESDIGGRVGVAALDTGSGAWLRHRADQRFAMCSTFKVLLAATVLHRVDVGQLDLGRAVRFTRADLLSYAPVTSARVEEGAMSVEALAAAAVEVSDNTAANLLLALVGGPAAVTRRMRGLGDRVTRLDRTEPELNTNLVGDVRDTTTPAAFVQTLRHILLGGGLSSASAQRLAAWMVDCKTGRDRLRAAAPPGWRAGDKTGSGANGAVNDVAIFWPPNRPPILIGAFLSGSPRPTEQLAANHAAIGRVVVDAFA